MEYLKVAARACEHSDGCLHQFFLLVSSTPKTTPFSDPHPSHPDVLICSVGSEIFYNAASPVLRTLLASSRQSSPLDLSPSPDHAQPPPSVSQGPEFLPDGSWEAFLDVGWDRSKAKALVEEHFPLLKPQVGGPGR